MSLRSLQILVLLLMYLPALVFGNTHAIVCMTEEGKLQFELGLDACDPSPADAAPSNSDKDCGGCADYKIKVGETCRAIWDNHCSVFQIQIVFDYLVNELHLLPVATPVEPSISTFDFIGSSILII